MSVTGESRAAWIGRLSPRDPEAVGRSVLPAAVLDELAETVGPGPLGWAVELGQGMASRITEELPAFSTDGVVQELRNGCEAVAVGALAALAVGQPPAWVSTQLLQGPVELVSRGIRMEEMLRSIQLAQTSATRAVVSAVQEVVPPAERFGETALVLDLILGVTEQAIEAMTREFAHAQKLWEAGSSAARLELVQEILDGRSVAPARALRTLGYDLTRQHTAVVLWSEENDAEPGHLPALAEQFLRARGCTATLCLPVGRRRVWAWGSSLKEPGAGEPRERPAPLAGVRVAVGRASRAGVEGFRQTHLEAVEAAAVGMRSTSDRRVFPYEDVDVLVLLMQRPELARDFVLRELGALAGPGQGKATLRATLKCYLDVERSLAQAASRLNVARNTVSYRIQRARDLRGLDVSERRMQLQAALTLAEEFGDLVLEPEQLSDLPTGSQTNQDPLIRTRAQAEGEI